MLMWIQKLQELRLVSFLEAHFLKLNQVELLDEVVALAEATRQKADVLGPLLVQDFCNGLQHAVMEQADAARDTSSLPSNRSGSLAHFLCLIVALGHWLLLKSQEAKVVILFAAGKQLPDAIVQSHFVSVILNTDLACPWKGAFLQQHLKTAVNHNQPHLVWVRVSV
jgi:hypothetical protein